jgi:hypothetical protein
MSCCCSPGMDTGRSRSWCRPCDHGEMTLTDSSRGPSAAVPEARRQGAASSPPSAPGGAAPTRQSSANTDPLPTGTSPRTSSSRSPRGRSPSPPVRRRDRSRPASPSSCGAAPGTPLRSRRTCTCRPVPPGASGLTRGRVHDSSLHATSVLPRPRAWHDHRPPLTARARASSGAARTSPVPRRGAAPHRRPARARPATRPARAR